MRGQMILRAMPAVASATGRAILAGQVEGDDPDKRGYTGRNKTTRQLAGGKKSDLVNKHIKHFIQFANAIDFEKL